ncbi:MAG: thioredoxin-like domain-containing protein [Planctomycetota bacterium]|jgi:thiol-disulfide isomerase/thioredoxin
MSEARRAPELDAGLAWLNTDRPLRLGHELRGQVVVLDFWTYCCMNCMHILPDLAHLEHKYRDDPVTFIGVHSAKFTNEASPETIRAAILRYEMRHPVVVDDNMKIWRAYGVRSWPTLVVIDSTGHVSRAVAGEGNRDVIDSTIARALEHGQANDTLADGPLNLQREQSVRATSGLAFPGKVLADAGTGRLFVADSNHNRIVVAELPDVSGRSRVVAVVGTGKIGAKDGPADQATFNHPQGLTLGHGKLYVADTENHLIRSVDLDSLNVTTIVGTGEMSNDRGGGLMGIQQGLNSPWDLTIEGSTLYVAMAGTNQIWRIDLPVGFARALAGTGRENIVDGPTEQAALAQPSGICIAGGNIFFADSEVSAVRGIDMASERVFTVIGEGLFSFGDVDGVHPQAKLQHPLGVEAQDLALLVADTYNHKIKRVDPGARSVTALYGTGKPGAATPDGQIAFFEPGGLSLAGDRLYVADTNNHRIVEINLETHEWYEVVLEGLTTPRGQERSLAEVIKVDAVSIAVNRDVELVLDIQLPPGAHLSPEAPWSVRVESDGRTLLQRTGKSERVPLTVEVPMAALGTGGQWQISASLAYCTESIQSLCVPIELAWSVRVETDGEGSQIGLSATA